MNKQTLAASLLTLTALLTGCAERQDANLPANILAYLGRAPARGVANDVAVIGDLAYVADAPFGISIYDLSQPSHPQLVDSIALLDPNVQLISIDSTGRIMAVQATNGLHLYDLSTRQFLFPLGSSGHDEIELQFDQNTLSVFRTDTSPGDGFNCERFENTGSGDTLAFGLPIFYSNYHGELTYGFARLSDIQAFVSLDYMGVGLVDFSTLGTANLLAQLNTPGRTKDAALSGSVLCLASGYEGLVTVDVSNPLNMVMLGSLAVTNATNLEHVEAIGNRAYILDTNDGCFAMDISNPSSPVLIGTLLSSNPKNFCISGGLVVIADEDMGLVVGQILY